MSENDSPDSGSEPIEILGCGWVWMPVDGHFSIFREGVDPRTAKVGDVLYVKREHLMTFVAMVDYAGEQFEVDGFLARARGLACPYSFRKRGTVATFSPLFGVPPSKGDFVTLPDVIIGKAEVDHVEWTYEKNGSRTAVVVLL